MASKESDSTKGSEYSTEQASEASSPGSHAISYQTTVGAYQNFVNFGVSIMTCKYCYQNLHITLEYWNNTVSMYKWRPFFPGPFLPRNPQNRTNVLCILCYIYKYFTSLLCPVILIQLCILQKKNVTSTLHSSISQTVLHRISTCITPFFESIRWYFWLMRPLCTTSSRLISTCPNDSFMVPKKKKKAPTI